MLLTEERTCRNGKVLDHRQLSALFLISNWRLLRNKLKRRAIDHGRQQLVFNKSFFISDSCFTNIYPGKIPTCGSQPHMQLQTLRFIYDCINTYPQKFQHLPESTFPLAIQHLFRIIFPFPIHIELMSETMDCFSIPDASIAKILVCRWPEVNFDRCIQLGGG